MKQPSAPFDLLTVWFAAVAALLCCLVSAARPQGVLAKKEQPKARVEPMADSKPAASQPFSASKPFSATGPPVTAVPAPPIPGGETFDPRLCARYTFDTWPDAELWLARPLVLFPRATAAGIPPHWQGWGWTSLGKITEWHTDPIKPEPLSVMFAASRPDGTWALVETVAVRNTVRRVKIGGGP